MIDVEMLKKYKELLDNNIITQEEFEKKKEELLADDTLVVQEGISAEKKQSGHETKKIIIACILAVLAFIILLSLLGAKREIVGLWTGEWDYNGKHINFGIEFTEDGRFGSLAFANNKLSSEKYGSYKVGLFRVICKDSTQAEIHYWHIAGHLINNGHLLTKN